MNDSFNFSSAGSSSTPVPAVQLHAASSSVNPAISSVNPAIQGVFNRRVCAAASSVSRTNEAVSKVSDFQGKVNLYESIIKVKMNKVLSFLSDESKGKIEKCIDSVIHNGRAKDKSLNKILELLGKNELSAIDRSFISLILMQLEELKTIKAEVSNTEITEEIVSKYKSLAKEQNDMYERVRAQEKYLSSTVSSSGGGGGGGAADPAKASAPVVSAAAEIFEKLSIVENNTQSKLLEFLTYMSEKVRSQILPIMKKHMKSSMNSEDKELISELDQLLVDSDGALTALDISYLNSLQSRFNNVNFLRDAGSFERNMLLPLLERKSADGNDVIEFLAKRQIRS